MDLKTRESWDCGDVLSVDYTNLLTMPLEEPRTNRRTPQRDQIRYAPSRRLISVTRP